MPASKTMRRLLTGAAVALALAPAAFAADVVDTIPSGGDRLGPIAASAPNAGDTYTIENGGFIHGPNVFFWSDLVITGSGAGRVVINNNGRIQGTMNFSALTGGVTFNNNTGPNAETQGWFFETTTPVFSAGNDIVNNATAGVIAPWGSLGLGIDFAGGDDAFNNAGTFVVGAGGDGVITLSSLETFDNSGTIVMGAEFYTAGTPVPPPTFGRVGDKLNIPDVDFIGSAGSRIAMDVRLGERVQTSCAALVTAADCLNLPGGTTSGVTSLLISPILPAEDIELNLVGMTLVDVAGGTSHAGDFVIDPASAGYTADGLFGGGIRRGDFTFTLLYDADTQAHRLLTLPDADFAVLGALPGAMSDLWRTADEAGRARQGELRRVGEDASGGLWGKVSGARTDREGESTASLFGTTDAVAYSYEQEDAAVAFGGDLVSGPYTVGLSLGYAQSSVTFDGVASALDLAGYTVGLYAGYRGERFFVDASASGVVGDMEGQVAFVPGEVEANATAAGGRIEAGWRLGLGQGFSVSPLASVVYVKSSLGEFQLPGDEINAVDFGNGRSLRGGLGAEATFEAGMGAMTLDLSLSGRAWKEFEGEAELQYRGRRAILPFSDEMSGDFVEVGAGADLGMADGRVSAFASIGGRFGEDYESASAALGVRYNW